MLRQPIAAVVIAIAGLALLAGCGGDDGDGGTASAGTDGAGTESAPSTKAEFVKQAEEVCKETQAEVQAKSKTFTESLGKKSPSALAKEVINDVVAPTFEKQVREIRALEPPASERKEVEAILASIEKMLDKITANPAAQTEYPYTEAEELAAKYGLKSCGHP